MEMTYKVLIVDDEKNIRMGIANNCAWTEYGIGQVMTACNGQEALQLILNEKPDIVITDIKMPIMDGLELIKKLLNYTRILCLQYSPAMMTSILQEPR